MFELLLVSDGEEQVLLVLRRVGLCVGKNQMCLTERWVFSMLHNLFIDSINVHLYP
jgi:hypothetical protein